MIMKKKLLHLFLKTYMISLGVFLAFLTTVIVAVAIAPIKDDWYTGSYLTANDLNSNFIKIRNAIVGIPEWQKGGTSGEDAVFQAGNVGIGSDDPHGLFEAGDIQYDVGASPCPDSSYIKLDYDGGGAPLDCWRGMVVKEGKVGIRTIEPSYHMDINGDLRVTGNRNARVMQLIFETDITEATNSVTVSGLNGDQDIEYKIIARMRSEASSTGYYFIRPNNDVGQNYGYQEVWGEDSTAKALRKSDKTGLKIGFYHGGIGELGLSNTILFAKTGYERTSVSYILQSGNGTLILDAAVNACIWNNTSDNITSIVIVSEHSNGIGVGSHIEVWARR
jgi:hypothetical protein